MRAEAIKAMDSRIKKALSNPRIFFLTAKDLMATLEGLGLSEAASVVLAHSIFGRLLNTEDVESTEREIFNLFGLTKVGEDSIVKILEEKMSGRAEVIYEQVSPYFMREAGLRNVLDYGYGDGQVSQLLADRLSLAVTGCDVKRYPAPHVTVPTIDFVSRCRLDCKDGSFDAGLMTNVAHHEEDNQLILDELKRIISPGGLLVVIETVPVDDTDIAREITFLNDYIYNRLFHQADVPVPGTYELHRDWPDRFRGSGFLMESSQVLGFDQPTIRDWHVLYVFRRQMMP